MILALAAFTFLYLSSIIIVYSLVRLTIPFFYLLFFGVIYFGTILEMNLSLPSDRYYYLLIIIFLMSFTVGVVIFNSKRSISSVYKIFLLKDYLEDSRRIIRFFTYALLFSALLTLLYYYIIGNNIIFLIANNVSSEDITTARVNSYSGPTYFAPGYFNQFKNILFPVSLTVLLMNLKRHRRKLWFIFFPICLFGLIGTGQRAFIMYSLLALMIVGYYLRKLQRTHVFFATTLVIALFGIASFYLGRTQELSVSAVLGNLLKRIFINEQHESLITFRYLYEIPLSYGSDWFRGIVGIFPGIKGSEIQHIVFGLIHGNPRGTAALSFIGSIYHNFGLIGVGIVPFIFSWVMCFYVYRICISEKRVGRVVIFGFISLYVAIYSTGDIVFLFNKGVVLLTLISIQLYQFRVKWK